MISAERWARETEKDMHDTLANIFLEGNSERGVTLEMVERAMSAAGAKPKDAPKEQIHLWVQTVNEWLEVELARAANNG